MGSNLQGEAFSDGGKSWCLVVVTLLTLLPAFPVTGAVEHSGDFPLSEALFREPPPHAQPQVWWHWMNGDVTEDGIAKDLAWMKRTGIGGVHYFDIGLGAPPVVEMPLKYLSAEWKSAVGFAVREADRLGLKMTIAASPGFSETGGPWVKPSDAMKKLVWSEVRVKGGEPVAMPVPHPPDVTGPFQSQPKPPSIAELTAMAMGHSLDELRQETPRHYGDALVLAFPAPGVSLPMPASMQTGEGRPLDAMLLGDGDLTASVEVPVGNEANPGVVTITFDAPQAVRSATIFAPGSTTVFAAAEVLPVLQVEDKGTWRTVAEMPLAQVPTTVSFPSVEGQVFRVVLQPFQDNRDTPASWQGAPGAVGFGFPDQKAEVLKIAELNLSAEPRIHRFEAKAGFAVVNDYTALEEGFSGGDTGVDPATVVDVTAHLQEDGRLDWVPPEGEWRILRLGYSLVGTENHPAPSEVTGLEVDKYDAEAVARYLDDYLSIFRETTGGMLGEIGISAILTDSIEAGASNWTPRLIEHFERLRGYDPRPWLPTLTGVLVGSREESDAFLYDFRRTLADLLAEQHYGTVAKVAHGHGLKVYGEALENDRPSLGDDMAMRAHADFPMAAYWAHAREVTPRATYHGDMKGASSVAHIYGANIAASESLTSAGFPWALAPQDLKPLVDIQFAHGINHIVIHSSVHQPLDDYLPGMSMATIGQFFNRHITWAEMARPWMDYIARSSYLLQQGRNVADVLYFYGEEAPLTALFARGGIQDLPRLFAYDFANSDVVLTQLSVAGGELVAHNGARYRALYLGGTSERMTLPVLQRIVELAEQGVTVVGQLPKKSPALRDDPAVFAAWVRRLEVHIVTDRDVDTVLRDQGISPGFTCENTDTCALRYVQRSSPEAEIFFLANHSGQGLQTTGRFRMGGRVPRLWHADTGRIEDVSYRTDGEITSIPLDLRADDAVFVVFQEEAATLSRMVGGAEEQELMTLPGPWEVAFEADRGAPPGISLTSLMSLSEHAEPGIRYFSGISSYRTELILDDETKGLHLDLGNVGDVAEVLINGESAGIAWKPPYRVAIGALAEPGVNSLEIRVANLWANRLIGDAQPAGKKITNIHVPTYAPDAPLRPSGLLGPVRLLSGID